MTQTGLTEATPLPSGTIPALHFPDVRLLAVFDSDGPRPQFLLDSTKLRLILAGLEPGQQLPAHPELLAVYYFLEGEGVMTVNGDEFPVAPGATVVAPSGSARGVRAATRLVFLAVRAGA